MQTMAHKLGSWQEKCHAIYVEPVEFRKYSLLVLELTLWFLRICDMAQYQATEGFTSTP